MSHLPLVIMMIAMITLLMSMPIPTVQKNPINIDYTDRVS